jgi:hypothetical protein
VAGRGRAGQGRGTTLVVEAPKGSRSTPTAAAAAAAVVVVVVVIVKTGALLFDVASPVSLFPLSHPFIYFEVEVYEKIHSIEEGLSNKLTRLPWV